MSFFKAHLGTLLARKQPFTQFENAILTDGGIYDKDLFMAEWALQHQLVKSQSSVALVAGAYKSGKIYGIAPQSGNLVPFALTRAGAATYFDKNGVMQTAEANFPRIDYDPATKACKGYLIEGAVTNICLGLSNNAAWGVSRLTKTLNSAISPDGTNTAIKIEVPAIASGGYILNSIITTGNLSGRTFTFSIWARSDISKPGCIMYSYGTPGTEDIKSRTVTVGTNWERFSFTFTFKSDMVSSIALFRFDLPSTSAIGDYVYLWGAQVEESTAASSHIPTTTTQVTRAADKLVSQLDLVNYPEASLLMDFTPLRSNMINTTAVYLKRSNNGLFWYANSIAATAQAYDGTTVLNDSTKAVNGNRSKMMTSFGVGTFKISVNGNPIRSSAYDGDFGASSPLEFGMGDPFIKNHIKSMSIFPKQLTDADHITLTT